MEQNKNQDINLSIFIADTIAGAAAGSIVVLVLVMLIVIIIIMNRYVYKTIINMNYELVCFKKYVILSQLTEHKNT